MPNQLLKKEYSFGNGYHVFAMNWSKRDDFPFRIGFGSFCDDFTNLISIVEVDVNEQRFVLVHQFEHPYPPTRLKFFPSYNTCHPDLIATASDHVRLWDINHGAYILTLKSEKTSSVTSFDWNLVCNNIVGAASFNGTSSIWDLEKNQVIHRVLAHKQEVFDFTFNGSTSFATVSADSSLRCFDLRDLKHSALIFEHPKKIPLIRADWSKINPYFIATIALDSNEITILDIRNTSAPTVTLKNHSHQVNSVHWSPHPEMCLCSGGEDKSAFIWFLDEQLSSHTHPTLHYRAADRVLQAEWSPHSSSWVAATIGTRLVALRA